MAQADRVYSTPPTNTSARRQISPVFEPSGRAGYSRADALRHDADRSPWDVDGAMTGPIREEANPFTREDAKGSESLRDLLDSPREIVDEILDLTTLLGVLLAGADADTCLPGIYRINGVIFEPATVLREALQCA